MEQKSSDQNMRPVFLVGGVLLFLIGLLLIIDRIKIQNTYERTTGVVVDFVVSRRYRHRDIVPKIRFTIDNRPYEVRVSRGFLGFPSLFLKIGDKVNILYSPQKPNSEIKIDSFTAKFGIATVVMIIGLLFFYIGKSIKID